MGEDSASGRASTKRPDSFRSVRRENGKLKAVPYQPGIQSRPRTSRGLAERSRRRDIECDAEALPHTRERPPSSPTITTRAMSPGWISMRPIDITIGPYETYNDELFGYKAAFEAYITLRDDAETDKVKFFSSRLQEIENNLPIDPKYRNPKIGALAPIRVVNELISSGDAAHGVRTAAFNLPNDERVVREKGSKRVMLKNVQEAKFKSILQPIAARVLEKRRDGRP